MPVADRNGIASCRIKKRQAGNAFVINYIVVTYVDKHVHVFYPGDDYYETIYGIALEMEKEAQNPTPALPPSISPEALAEGEKWKEVSSGGEF